jgi:hypothetical protein
MASYNVASNMQRARGVGGGGDARGAGGGGARRRGGQGLTLIHVRAQLEQLQDTLMS